MQKKSLQLHQEIRYFLKNFHIIMPRIVEAWGIDHDNPVIIGWVAVKSNNIKQLSARF